MLAALMCAAVASTAAANPESAPFGGLQLFEPVGSMRGFVVLYSGETGWGGQAQRAAVALSQAGALVVGVDLLRYRALIQQGARKCAALVGDAEVTARNLQRERGYPDYHAPILAGIGVGGALAGAILRVAPPATLAGAVALDPRTPPQSLCAAADTRVVQDGLPGFWVIGSTGKFGDAADPKKVVDASAALTRVSVPDASVALTDLVLQHLDATVTDHGLAKLPLIELRADSPSPLLAIVLSGDGGWRDLDKVIAEDLRRSGISVLGWDSLRYFWSYKTPAQAAQDLGTVIETYAARWHAQKVALIGYSFGADVLPLLYGRLPESAKGRVAQISLLALSNAADFEIKVTGWLGAGHDQAALPTEPALASIRPALIQCFYGASESDSVCPMLSTRGAEVIQTAGGHHFDGDYAALAQRILVGFKARGK
jgi:type IV secretory pathway VirJ component